MVPLVTPTNSPRIGPRSEAYISIPESAANGYISFSQPTVITYEPDTGFGNSLILELTRSGAYGTATVAWSVVSITTDSSDLGTLSGATQIENGNNLPPHRCLKNICNTDVILSISPGSTESSTTNQIVIVILNDDEPEIDETFEVQLVSVAGSGQRINPEQVTS